MATATLAARVAKLEKAVAKLTEKRAGTLRTKRKLKSLSRPPLQGLPSDLSEGTRQKVQDLIIRRHATDR